MSNKIKLAIISLPLVLAACASTPESTPALLEAQQAYQAAKNNPDVLRYATDQLEEAEMTLRRAADSDELADMNSLAYVANNQVQIAEAVTRQEVAEARISELSALRDRVQLQSRERYALAERK